MAAGVIAAGVLLIGLLCGSNAPERLSQVPASTSLLGIANGWLIVQGDPAQPNALHTIRAVPLDRSGTQREVLRWVNAPGGRMVHPIFSEAGFFFVRRRGKSSLPSPESEWHLQHIALTGGENAELPASADIPVIASCGFCYWVRPTGHAPGAIKDEMTDLLRCPQGGGAVRVVGRVPALTHLFPSPTGVTWSVLHENGAARDWVHLAAADDSLTLVRDLPEKAEPVELAGRVYWIDDLNLPDGTGIRVNSALLDGTDRRVELQLGPEDGRNGWLEGLAAHRGKLYCLFCPRSGGAIAGSATQLCHIRLGARPALDKVRALRPDVRGRGYFSDGYFYFGAHEKTENWFNWSLSGLTPGSRYGYFRTRLPG